MNSLFGFFWFHEQDGIRKKHCKVYFPIPEWTKYELNWNELTFASYENQKVKNRLNQTEWN